MEIGFAGRAALFVTMARMMGLRAKGTLVVSRWRQPNEVLSVMPECADSTGMYHRCVTLDYFARLLWS